MGKKMPVAVILGGDPVYTYAATARCLPMWMNICWRDSYERKKVELVKCITLTEERFGFDIHVPADADIVIEGYVIPLMISSTGSRSIPLPFHSFCLSLHSIPFLPGIDRVCLEWLMWTCRLVFHN